MIRLAILLLLIPGAASAQTVIARPAAEDCSLASISSVDAVVTINWPCVEVYAAKTNWQDVSMHSMAIALKAARRDGSAK